MEGKEGNHETTASKLIKFLFRHSKFASIVFYICGLAFVILLPAISKDVYVDENALMPGSSFPMYEKSEAINAVRYGRQLFDEVNKNVQPKIQLASLLEHYFLSIGGEFFIHCIPPPSSSTLTSSSLKRKNRHDYRFNMVGLIKSKRGKGDECIVFLIPVKLQSFKFYSNGLNFSNAMSIAFGISLAELLSNADWLSRNVIFVFYDTELDHEDDNGAVNQWLYDYHMLPNPKFGPHSLNSGCNFNNLSPIQRKMFNFSTNFLRSGLISAALALEFDENWNGEKLSSVFLKSECQNGQKSNMDLVSLTCVLNDWLKGFELDIENWDKFENNFVVKSISEIFETIFQFFFFLSKNLKLKISAGQYRAQASRLIKQMINQAMGFSTGVHGSFLSFQIDSISLKAFSSKIKKMAPPSPSSYSIDNLCKQNCIFSLINIGRLSESIIHCLSNLEEKLHHSSPLYLLSSHNKFISISTYIIPFSLLLLPLFLLSSSSFFYSFPSHPTQHGEPFLFLYNVEFMRCVLYVMIMHLWSLYVAFSPKLWVWLLRGLGRSYSVDEARFGLSLWLLSSLFTLLIFSSFFQLCSEMFDQFLTEFKVEQVKVDRERSESEVVFENQKVTSKSHFEFTTGELERWRMLKAVSLGFVGIELAALSFLNFSVALFSMIFIFPICIGFQPLYVHMRELKTKLKRWFEEFSVIQLGSIPVVLFVLWSLFHRLQIWNGADVAWCWLVENASLQSVVHVFMIVTLLPFIISFLNVFLN